ncbi:MAG: C39 family peptidase [Spirochaetes bacterium]|nr:C39 family peptidase [Spirochaetota bacterium]
MKKVSLTITLICIIFLFSFQNPTKTDILLDVDFISQYPPGTGWGNTNNCSQTSFYMAYCYFKNQKPTVQGIKDIDDWLSRRLGLPINQYNGSKMNHRQLISLIFYYGQFSNSQYHQFYNLNKVKKDLLQNKPVIAIIHYPSPGNKEEWIAHAVLIIGMSDEYIYIHDPGKTKGANQAYRKAKFKQYWSYYDYPAFTISP